MYDPGCNVPFVVRWPGVVKAGGESRVLLSGEDLAPLACSRCRGPSGQDDGLSFLPLLKGESFVSRKHVFTERGPHGSAPVTVNMKSSGYDLSRAVRSEHYKLIYNCTPWIPYGPVDSAGGAAWQQIGLAFTNGTLAPELVRTYFTTPRPVYELYDLESDPSELQNLSGQPELAEVERELRVALTEKMILDFDYLPLPALPDTTSAAGKGVPKAGGGNRSRQFTTKDRDGDGKLSFQEFATGREPTAARKWFDQRDINEDGFLSHEEFVPSTPLPRKE